MKRGLLSLLAIASVAALTSIGLPGTAGASEREVEHSGPSLGGPVTCMALHCPRPLPPEFCDEAGNCEIPPDPGCYEGPDGGCLPPWCDPAAPLEECPAEPPLPPWCEEVTNGDTTSIRCEPPRPPICEEGTEATDGCIELPSECWVDEAGNIGCLPPWCDPEAGVEGCVPEPPLPPICDQSSDPSTDFCIPPRPPICEEGTESTEDCVKPPPPPVWCEDGSEVCVPPMPPWCDPAGNCKPPPCQPDEETGSCWPDPCFMWGTPEDCEWSGPDDPTVCVMGWPEDGPMPDCPWVYPPSPCGDGEVRSLPAPNGKFRLPGRGQPNCPPLPPLCDPSEPGTVDPGEGEPGVESVGEGDASASAYRSEEIPRSVGDGSSRDPLPCSKPPFYGCWDVGNGTICVDPPLACWGVEGKDGLVACPAGPEARPTQTGNEPAKSSKAKKAKAKAKARARAKKAKARAEAAKAKKAKAKAKARR